MISVREGWRPVRAEIVVAQRSPVSGRRAMTTRFITLVLAATWRSSTPPTMVTSRGPAQIRASSRSMSAMLVA